MNGIFFTPKHMRGVFSFIPISEDLPAGLANQLLGGGMTCLVIRYKVSTVASWPCNLSICFGTCILGNESFALAEYLGCELLGYF